MTKSLLAAFLLMACGSNQPNTKTGGSGSGSATAAECDCGAEPPISPSVCPEGAKVSTTCARAESGSCERKILCDGKEQASAPPATQP
jgi:hypothetical protein